VESRRGVKRKKSRRAIMRVTFLFNGLESGSRTAGLFGLAKKGYINVTPKVFLFFSPHFVSKTDLHHMWSAVNVSTSCIRNNWSCSEISRMLVSYSTADLTRNFTE